MKWIKASDRLPIFTHRLISRFIHTQTPMFDFKEWALRNSDKLNLVEWLDESSPSDNTQIRDGWELYPDNKPAVVDKEYLVRLVDDAKPYYEVGYFDGDEFSFAANVSGNYISNDDITHWMPIPTPPND